MSERITDFSLLLDAAYHSERVASRRLARRAGISEEQALRRTLLDKAGAAGLPALLAERGAEQAATAARAQARAARGEALRQARAKRHQAPAGTWRAWFDGSARPNPGRCGIGALLTGPDGQSVEISLDAGYGNSSEAEYRALIAVLQAAIRHGAHGLAIHGDSRVVIDDVSGKAQAPALTSLRLQAAALLARLDGASLHWIPRHKNGAADALSQRGADATENGSMV
jgi:ribonuclease HI